LININDAAKACLLAEELRLNSYTCLLQFSSSGNLYACIVASVGAAPFPPADLTLNGAIYLDPSIRTQAGSLLEAVQAAYARARAGELDRLEAKKFGFYLRNREWKELPA